MKGFIVGYDWLNKVFASVPEERSRDSDKQDSVTEKRKFRRDLTSDKPVNRLRNF